MKKTWFLVALVVAVGVGLALSQAFGAEQVAPGKGSEIVAPCGDFATYYWALEARHDASIATQDMSPRGKKFCNSSYCQYFDVRCFLISGTFCPNCGYGNCVTDPSCSQGPFQYCQ